MKPARGEMDIIRSMVHQEDAINYLESMHSDNPLAEIAIQKLAASHEWLLKFLEGRENQRVRVDNLKDDNPVQIEYDDDEKLRRVVQRIADQMYEDMESLDINNRPYSNRVMNLNIELGNIRNRLEDLLDGWIS